MVAMFADGEHRRTSNPSAGLLEDAERDPTPYEESDAELLREFQPGGKMFAMIAKAEESQRGELPPVKVTIRPMAIRRER